VANAAGGRQRVNTQAVYRHGEYYPQELTITNGSARNMRGDEQSGAEAGHKYGDRPTFFLPKTPKYHPRCGRESFGDGRWTNTWDAENRVSSSMSGISHTAEAARQKLGLRI